MSDDVKLRKPLCLVPPKSVSRRDILRAERQSGICIIECSDPSAARFKEAPVDADIDLQSRAALELLRMVMASSQTDFKRGDMTKWFVKVILNGGKPLSVPPVPRTAK